LKKLLKQLASESAIYGISSMLSKFIGIFLVPLYTHLLLPSDYGTLNLVNSTFYFIIVFACFALDSASARWYYDTENADDRKSTISSWFWFQLTSSIILGIIIIISSSFLSKIILKENNSILFIIPAIGLLFNILPSIVTNWLRFQRKAVHTVIFTICNILINVALNIFFVLYLKLGVKGILLSLLLSNIIASIYVIFLLKDWISISFFNMNRLKEMLKFSIPLLPTAIAFWVLNSSSSFIIEKFHSKSEVGLYSIGSMLASVVTMVVGAFQMAWGPFAFSIIEHPNAKKTFAMVLTMYSALMCFVALSVALFAKEGLMLFTAPEYHKAYIVSGILAFNGIIYGYAYIGSIGTSIAKDNKPLAISILFAALITGVLYFSLVPKYGKEGAAISILLGYLIVPIYLFYKSQKLWHIPFNFSITFLIFIFSTSIYLTWIAFFQNASLLNGLFIKIGLISFYLIFIIAVLKSTYKEEYNELIQKLKKGRN
jgi:O-antigen/teichoic acid export membrane protein